jgi:hypothetical protein
MMNEESIELMRGIDRKLDDYLLRSLKTAPTSGL